MAIPSYAPPVRQKSEVLRSDDELRAMRAAELARLRNQREQQKADWLAMNPRRNDPNAPGVADFMQQTGANTQQALDAIYKYRDWENYTPEGGWKPVNWDDTSFHNNTGEDFQFKFGEPETAGSLVPIFKQWSGGGATDPYWSLQSVEALAPGSVGGTIDTDSKQSFYNDAMGMGVGTAGLDAFAQQFGARNWDALNWGVTFGDYSRRNAPGVYSDWSGPEGSTMGGTWSGPDAYRRHQFDGPYGIQGNGETQYYGADGAATPWSQVPGSSSYLTEEQRAAKDQFRAAQDWWKGADSAARTDFDKTMAEREGNAIRAAQGYQAQLGGGFTGGVLDERYSDPFFGQITGRAAQQSPFTMESGAYPWSNPTQQLDISSLLAPGYGGPGGGGSMGAYGGMGGLGGLGGMRQQGGSQWGGPFGRKSPWDVS